MSSPQPYQSRLLNFLNRQRLEWRERLEISARKIKTVATWSLQLLLYPVYFLVQTGRLGLRQLAYQVSNLKLPSSSNNNSIVENVLDSLDQPSVVGIACNLEDHQLILTQDQGTISLPPQQNQALKQRIYLELVEYYRQTRLSQSLKKQLPPLVTKSNNTNILPPLRFFWQTLAWVEGGKLAKRLDFFGENRLVYNSNSTLSLQSNYSIRALLDLIKAALEYFWGLQNNPSFPQEPKFYLESKSYLIRLSNSLNSDADPFQIKYIIYAALEYFFKTKQQLLVQNNLASLPAASEEDDPWLSSSDFLLVSPLDNQQEEEHPLVLLPPSLDTVSIEKSIPEESPVVAYSTEVTLLSEVINESLVKSENTEYLEYTPDWIETEATPLGYVEHPLEKSIKWLDRIILWIEEILIQLWKWCKKIVNKPRGS